MVQVHVFQVGQLPDHSGHLLLLKPEGDDQRVLPISIAQYEAVSIAMGVAGVTPPRPMPYELLSTVITRLGGELKQVVIHDLREGTFIGQLEIATKAGIIEVDCRPSDAVALAVRTSAPIFVTEEVLDQAGAPLPQGLNEGSGEAEPPIMD